MTSEDAFFSCKQCGHCCHGETTVSLDATDQTRLSHYLRLPFDEVKARYLRDTEGVIQMKIMDGHCIFYKKGCTVHRGKPWRCSEWPLHPSILADRSNFEAIGSSCPGIKKELGYEKFCRLFREYLEGEKNVGKK